MAINPEGLLDLSDASTSGLLEALAYIPRNHSCSYCSKSYRRPEHLTRHTLAAHNKDRPFQCSKCRVAAFRRKDVCTRHEKICSGTGRGVEPLASPRERKACGACVRRKRKCDGNFSTEEPCSECRKRGVVCEFALSSTPAYGDSDADLNFVVSGDQDLQDLYGACEFNLPGYEDILGSFDPLELASTEALDEFWGHAFLTTTGGATTNNMPSLKPEMPLRFLESFTRNHGLVASFDCCSPEQRTLAYSWIQAKMERMQSSFTADYLAVKSREIVSLVEEVVTTRPRNSAVSLTWSSALEDMCTKFFAPSRLILYLELYWAIWHPNVNYMHRPSFDPRGAKAVLVAAMSILGASVCPDEVIKDSARQWLTCVEEMVFQDDDFCIDEGEVRTFPSIARIEALQAAYMVCLFQNWEGTDASKRRIRRFRYSTVVSVARDIGIEYAQHPIYHLQPHLAFSWESFVTREGLIRLFLWIFLLDTAFVIFHNSPPRFAIKEMKMHFACSEGCFQATSREACFDYIRSGTETYNLQFSSLTKRLCQNIIDSTAQALLADLGPLNLFALTSAVHSMIFHVQQSFSVDIQMSAISNALSNWIAIWQMYTSTYSWSGKHNPLGESSPDPETFWKRIGFSRYAAEYWLLGKLITERIAAAAQTESERINMRDDVIESSGHTEPTEPTLPQYDQTSMRQVNDLISEFQKVLI